MAEIELPKLEELEEIKAKSFTRRAALITAIFAGVLAISSLGGGKATKEMILAQDQASDLWSYYQAKVIREQLYRGQKMRLELDLLAKETLNPEIRQHYEDLLKQATTQAEHYAQQQKTIEEEARKMEHERDLARSKDPYFEFSEALLQIAIIMASVAILSQSRAILGVAIAAASLGTLLCLNGFFLFLHLPFLSH
jgi:NAD(P)H-dependent FMN reductase